MRISDWSSDVCSSDLVEQHAVAAAVAEPSLEHRLPGDLPRCAVVAETVLVHVHAVDQHAAVAVRPRRMPGQRRALEPVVAEIGRAHVSTPVTNAHLVCRLLLENKNTILITTYTHTISY